MSETESGCATVSAPARPSGDTLGNAAATLAGSGAAAPRDGESSDLDDLRNLAAALEASDPRARQIDVDELLVLGGGFDASLGTPLLVASKPEAPRSRHPAFWTGVGAMIGITALVLGSLLAMSWQRVQRGQQQEEVQLAAPALASTRAPAPEPVPAKAPRPPLEPLPQPPATPIVLQPTTIRPSHRERDESEHSADRSSAQVQEPAEEPAPPPEPVATPEPQPVEAAPSAPVQEIEQLLGLGEAPSPAAEGNGSGLPQSLTRAQVVEGLRPVAQRVANCDLDGTGSQVVVDVTIEGTNGQVSRALVIGPLAGTPTGQCIERAVRGARFPQFLDPQLRVSSYPFSLR